MSLNHILLLILNTMTWINLLNTKENNPIDWPPRGFGDLGRMAIYFQGADALVIILGELGSKLIVLGI